MAEQHSNETPGEESPPERDANGDTNFDAAAGSHDSSSAGDSQADDASVLSDEALADFLNDARADGGEGQDAGGTESAHLEDLKRVQAEYANYRRRTEQERALMREAITADVLRGFLAVLDDLDRAEKHGDLTEGSAFQVVGSKLRTLIEKAGLIAYGTAGEAFDPNHHEAIAQLPNPEVESEIIADVVAPGYRLGERTVRVAKVAVFVPQP